MTAARSVARPDGPGPLRWDTGLLLVAALAQGGFAVWLGHDGWFSNDLLHHYLERGGAPGGTESAMDPHHGQWVTVLVVAHVLLFKVAGLTSYVPYLVLGIVVHLALVLAMNRVLVRLGAGRGAALVAALVLLTYGAGSGAFLSATGIAQTAPLLLGALAVPALLGPRPRASAALRSGILLLLAVATSWTGLVVAGWVVVLALRPGLRTGLVVAAPPVVGLLGWYGVWGRGGIGEALSFPDDTGAALVEAVMTTASSLDGVLGGWGLGPVALLGVLAAVAAWWRARPALALWAGAGLVAAMVHALGGSVFVRSADLGTAAASSSRYVLLVMLLPGVALLLDGVASRALRAGGRESRRAVVAAACVAAAVVAFGGVALQERAGDALAADGERIRSLLAGTVEATESGEKVLSDVVPDVPLRGDHLAALASPDLRLELPGLQPTEQARIDAESSFFVAVSSDELTLAPPMEARSGSFSRPIATRSGCREYTADGPAPTLTLSSYLGAGFRYRGGAAAVTTWLSRPTEGVRGAPVEWPAEPGTWTHVATTAQLAELAVTFDAGGDYTICFED